VKRINKQYRKPGEKNTLMQWIGGVGVVIILLSIIAVGLATEFGKFLALWKYIFS